MSWSKALGGVADVLLQLPEMRMRAAELALRQKAEDRAAGTQQFENSMKLVGSMPIGSTIGEDAASKLSPEVRAFYTQPETKPEFLWSRPMQGTTADQGFGVQTAPKDVPTGRFSVTPFEDVKQRAIALRQTQSDEAKMARLRTSLATRTTLEAQKNALIKSYRKDMTDNEKLRINVSLTSVLEKMRYHDAQIAQDKADLAAQTSHWGQQENIAWTNAQTAADRVAAQQEANDLLERTPGFVSPTGVPATPTAPKKPVRPTTPNTSDPANLFGK